MAQWLSLAPSDLRLLTPFSLGRERQGAGHLRLLSRPTWRVSPQGSPRRRLWEKPASWSRPASEPAGCLVTRWHQEWRWSAEGRAARRAPSLGKDVGTPTCPLPPPTDTGVTHCLRPPLSGRQPLTPQLERLAARSVEAPQHFAALWSEASGAACAGGRAVGHLVGRSQEVTSGVGPCGMGIGARGPRDAPAAAVAPGSSVSRGLRRVALPEGIR